MDAGQLRHRWLDNEEAFDFAMFNLALQELGFDSRAMRSPYRDLSRRAQPAVVLLKDGSLAIAGGFSEQGLVLQKQGEPEPAKLDVAAFEALWGGHWLDARRRATTQAEVGSVPEKFGVSWFLKAMSKYRSLLAEVLMASLFVQVFALMTPLVFQVVIDKVLTHRSLSTLDVLALALAALAPASLSVPGMTFERIQCQTRTAVPRFRFSACT